MHWQPLQETSENVEVREYPECLVSKWLRLMLTKYNLSPVPLFMVGR